MNMPENAPHKLGIFLVEDSQPVLERYREMIDSMEGARLIGEADEESMALKKIPEANPDLIVLDLNLKNGNGFEILRKIKLSHPEITIAVVTNFSHPQIKSRCIRLGADYFFDKTSGNKMFVELLDQITRRLA